MSQTEKLAQTPSAHEGLFGVSTSVEQAQVVVIGVPWEPTASYGRGTSATPTAMVPASHQLDFFEPLLDRAFGHEVAMVPPSDAWLALNRRCCDLARPIIAAGKAENEAMTKAQLQVNQASQRLNRELYKKTTGLLQQGKTVAVLGGDHASPFGHIQACLAFYPGTGILHIDAHHDLRTAYQGFTFSHASIMHNVITGIPQLNTLVSVAIRDFSEDEHRLARNHPKIHTFYDRDLSANRFKGQTWAATCHNIIDLLPASVYVTFDIDGCKPDLCPHTGTPVPGGLDFQQAVYLLEALAESGRRMVGFDLCEVAPNPNDPQDEWDLNVGARILHKLCALAYKSRL